ncbi:bacteriocin [Neisseria oralis]|nr:bacteriocin [Neisseria oralis]
MKVLNQFELKQVSGGVRLFYTLTDFVLDIFTQGRR